MKQTLVDRIRSKFAIEEDAVHPVPPEAYSWRPYALSCAACLAAANAGYNAFVSTSIHLPSFQNAFGLQKDDITKFSANLMTIFAGGALAGSLIGYIIGERWGRKRCIVLTAFISIVGSLMQILSNGNLGLLFAGRAVTGLAIGAKISILPAYIAEIAPSTIRGRLVGLVDIFAQSAQLVGFWVSYGVQQHISPKGILQWRIPFALQLIPAGLLIVSMSLAVESPRWLMVKGRSDVARENLSWVRNLPQDHEFVNWEMKEMRRELEGEEARGKGRSALATRWKELMGKGVRRRIILVLVLKCMHTLSGIDMLSFYGPQIFAGIGFKSTSEKLLATGIHGVIKAVVNAIFVLFFIDVFGRRRPLMIGSVIIVACLFYLGAYTDITSSFTQPTPRNAGSWIAAVAIYLYSAGFSISWAVIPFIFGSEVFPTRIRALALMLIFCLEWGMGIGVLYGLPYMIDHMTYGTFYFFGSCTVISGIVVWLFVPETKGFELERMHLLFEGSLLARNARQRADEKLRDAAARNMSDVGTVEVLVVEPKNDGSELETNRDREDSAIEENIQRIRSIV